MNHSARITEISNTLKELIQFRSTEDRPEQLNKLANYVVNFFSNAGLYLQQYDFNGKPALVITTRKTKRPKIFFQGHLDVVEGDDSQFVPRTNGVHLYGRGAVDMKGFDAIVMHLLRNKSALQDEYDIGIMLTSDEETGGQNGALQLRNLGYDCDCLVNGDGGYHHALIYAEKGILKFKMSVATKPGRHPNPWRGENAFDILVQNYENITSLFPHQKQATDEDNWYTTYSSYDVRVENEALFFPDRAEMKINIYFIEPLSADAYFEKIKKVVGDKVSITKILASERVYANPDHACFREMQKIMQQQFKREIPARTENGSSDARYFSDNGRPVLIVKVVGRGLHTPEEYIHLPSIAPMYASLEAFVDKFGKVDE